MISASAPGMGSAVVRALRPLGLALGATALLLLVAGPLGWRAGWWHYSLGFNILLPSAGYVGIAAVVVSVAGLVLGMRGASGRGIVLAVLGIALGAAAAYFPWSASEMRGRHPRLNDITTDFENPPSLAFSEAMRQAEHGGSAAYAGSEAAALQRKAYPDIEPAVRDIAPAQAFAKALTVARAKGWTIVRADAAAGIVEAIDRSRWFGFSDDIAIRVRAWGEGSRIDIRSHARQGRGDFGVNAARVSAFLAAVKASS